VSLSKLFVERPENIRMTSEVEAEGTSFPSAVPSAEPILCTVEVLQGHVQE